MLSLGVPAILSSAYDSVLNINIDNKLFLYELQNATYVGNGYTSEAVGNIIVSHTIFSKVPRRESVRGYMSFMAHDSVNKEMGNIGVISEFDLREPSKQLRAIGI